MNSPETIHLSSEDIPVYHHGKHFDVLVVGGGSSGVPAAIAAARRGKKTLIVEQLAFLGGTATAALVTPLMHNCIPGNPSSSSINMEINERVEKAGGGGKDENGNAGWFDPLILSFVLEEMALEAGVEIMYNTFFSDVIVEDNTINGIVVQNKGGRMAVMASRVIDATGDADVAWKAGAPFESGRPETGINQPTSLRFEMGGVDMRRFIDFIKSLGQQRELDIPYFHTAMVWGKNWPLEPIFRMAVENKDLEERDGEYFQAFGIPGKADTLAFNCPEIPPEKDITRPDYQNMALARGRKDILRLANFMKKYFRGFEKAHLSRAAVMLGIRESRRIVGEHVLTGKEILSYEKFDDAIARSNYPVDIHGALDEYENYKRPDLPEKERYFEVPFRSLVPLKVENLLVVGRCFSSDYVGQSSPRIQPTCRAMGEASGIAAALSIDEDATVRRVDGARVRSEMKKNPGVNL